MKRSVQRVDGFEFPHGSLIIWRYMGLEKFLDLISSNRIRLTRASHLTDNRELRLPLDKLESDYYRSLRKDESGEAKAALSYRSVNNMKERVNLLKEKTYVSCWSISRHDSYALWKIYLSGGKAGVAIKSTVSSLEKSIDPGLKGDVFLSRVNYTDDPKTEKLKDSYYVLNKSKHYEFENELRLFTYADSNEVMSDLPGLQIQPSSILLTVDPKILIKEICLSPFVASSFRKTLEKVIEKVNPAISAKVVPSEIKDI